MIVRPPPRAFALLFALRGSIVPMIAPQVLFVVLLSAAVAWFDRIWPGRLPVLAVAPFALVGITLSIFMGFRNSACYDRWWEARKQWGQLLVEMRCLARDCTALLPDPALRRRIIHRGVAFAHALAAHLRQSEHPTLPDWLPANEWDTLRGFRNRPDAILRALTGDIAACLRDGTISDILYRQFEQRLTAMSAIQTACERIRGTPPPYAYKLLLHRTAWLFCLLLPFGIAPEMGMVAPLVSALLAYAFFGLDALGDELEEPFGLSQNDLPLNALVRIMEIDAAESLGDAIRPEPLQPVRYVLQ